jgi:hypothetical protein
VPVGDRYRLAAALPGRGERADLRREPELRQAPGLEVGSADPPGQDGALQQVPFGAGQPQGRLDGPQVHQRHRPQVVTERDVLVGLPRDRGGQESGLPENPGQVTAPRSQRQLQRRDRHPQAASAIRWRRLGVRRSDRQVGRRLVQAPPSEVMPGADQCQLRMVRARREGPQQRPDGLLLPVHRQAERMVGQQPGRISPVTRRLGVPDGVGSLAMPGEPPRGPPVQPRHLHPALTGTNRLHQPVQHATLGASVRQPAHTASQPRKAAL